MNDIKHLCSGCGICAGICSANALTMELNADGFYRPNRNNKCTNCGLCNAICPFKKIAAQPNNETIDTVFGSYHSIFAAYSKNKTIRKSSSTGGFIRTFLSYYANQFDGVIVLTETDNPLKPQVDCLDKSDDILTKSTKSIYFHIEFSQAVKILKNKKGRFIIVGTPCQIAGINNINAILKRDIFTIELFCGSLYSHNLMQKYFALKGETPIKLDFKDKSVSWHRVNLSIQTNNGNNICTSVNDYEFYFALQNRFSTQEACLKCSYCYRGTADIQVGDFWGEKYQHDDIGTNLVISRTARATEMIENCSDLKLKVCTIDDVHKSQPWFVLADNRIKKYNGYTDVEDLPVYEQLENKLKLNRIMQDYINKAIDIAHIRDVYFKHLRDITGENKSDNRSGFLLLPSDGGSLQSFGDQAMNATLLEKIHDKYPNTKVAYFAQYYIPDFSNLPEDYGYNVPIFYPSHGDKDSIKRFENVSKDYKTLIVIGADILDGGCGRKQAMDYFSIMQSALMQGMEVITTGLSFNDKHYPEITSKIAALSHMGLKINVRDKVSFERLKSYGCINLTQVADMAFLFDETKYKCSLFAQNLTQQIVQYRQEGKKILGLHITANKENIEQFTDKITSALKKYNQDVLLLLPHDYRCYDGIISDKQMIDVLYKKLSDNGLNVINGYDLRNEIDVKSVVGFCDLLITCRMHIAIAALSKNVPIISFVYQGKFEGLYKFYEFKQNLMFEKDTFEVNDFVSAIDYCLSNDLKQMINTANKHVFELSSHNFDFLQNDNPPSQENHHTYNNRLIYTLIIKKNIYRLLKHIFVGRLRETYKHKYKKIKYLLRITQSQGGKICKQ